MDINKPFNFLVNLPPKLNRFYKKEIKKKIVTKNKSKNINNFDPVTNIDRSLETYIRKLIKKNFSIDSISGEEFTDKNLSKIFRWWIDPIDGTKAFISGIPTWSNLIGYSFNNKSILGLVNFPILERFYINDKKNSYVFSGEKRYFLKTNKKNDFKNLKIICNFHKSISRKKENSFKKNFGQNLIITKLDALSYCLLSEGKIDAVIESNLKPFDIIPLIPIIKNSGGIISNWKNQPAEMGGNILATSNKKLHVKMLKMIKKFVI